MRIALLRGVDAAHLVLADVDLSECLFTGGRFEKALNITLNSVVFCSAEQDLTTAGTYIEMGSRVTEPVLLGLAVLAVRNRVKH